MLHALENLTRRQKCHSNGCYAYVPTLTSPEDDPDHFYKHLDHALTRVPQNDKIILLGDFNA